MSFDFEKFIKDIEKRNRAHHEKSTSINEQEEISPQRKYNQLYRERWQNRIVWGNHGHDQDKT